MRASFIFFGLLSWLSSAAADEAPFSPIPNVPDYVMTMVVRPGWGPATDDLRTVTHGAGWTRIDLVEDGHRSTSHMNDSKTVSVNVAHTDSGEYLYAAFVRDAPPQMMPGWFHGSFRTGERQALLGESCEVWEILQGAPRDVPHRAFSCVTDDGIELWQKAMSRDNSVTRSAEATSIRRQIVRPSDVLPPSDLLDLRSWTDSAVRPGAAVAPPATPRDFEAMLHGTSVTRTTRRHHPWTTEATIRDVDGMRRLSFMNDVRGLYIDFEGDEGGGFRSLLISKDAPGAGHPMIIEAFHKPVDQGRKESILGEECAWFDTMSLMMDGGTQQCKTSDGIVLKEQTYSRAFVWSSLVAIALHRRDVEPAEVLPPGDIFNRRKWGIPE